MIPHKRIRRIARHFYIGVFVVRKLRYFHVFHRHNEFGQCQ